MSFCTLVENGLNIDCIVVMACTINIISLYLPFMCIFNNNALEGWVVKRKVLKKWVLMKNVWEALH